MEQSTIPPLKGYDGHEISFIDDCFSVLDNEAESGGSDDDEVYYYVTNDDYCGNVDASSSASSSTSTNKHNAVDSSDTKNEESLAFYWSFNTLRLFDSDEYFSYQKRSTDRTTLSTADKNENLFPFFKTPNKIEPLESTFKNRMRCLDALFEASRNDMFGGVGLNLQTDLDNDLYVLDGEDEEDAEEDEALYLKEALETEKSAGRAVFPLFEKYIMDPTLKTCLLPHLYDFCKSLSAQDRIRAAELFPRYMSMDDVSSFRLRVLFAEQLTLMVKLYDVQEVNRYFSGIALLFSADKISEVRNKGIELLAEVVASMIGVEWKDNGNEEAEWTDNENYKTIFSIDLSLTQRIFQEIRRGFWNSRNWRQRQSFGRLLHTLLSKKLITDRQISFICFDDLMRLSNDPVPNVRQYFCMIAQLTVPTSLLFARLDLTVSQAMKACVTLMRTGDSDSEIRYMANEILLDLGTNSSSA